MFQADVIMRLAAQGKVTGYDVECILLALVELTADAGLRGAVLDGWPNVGPAGALLGTDSVDWRLLTEGLAEKLTSAIERRSFELETE